MRVEVEVEVQLSGCSAVIMRGGQGALGLGRG